MIALATLILCSCRALPPRGGDRPGHYAGQGPAPGAHGFAPGVQAPSTGPLGDLPPQAWTGGPGDGYTIPANATPMAPGGPQGIPLPTAIITPWAPPGIAQPWPHDEYLHDGGDREVQVTVGPDYDIHGLEMEDTIAHYDTIDGRTIVKPSNRVCIYAPRFGAVRRVDNLLQSEQRDKLVETEAPVKAQAQQEELLVGATVQPVQLVDEVALRQVNVERLRQGPSPVSNRLLLLELENGFLPYENLAVIRLGQYENSEKARLAEGIEAAIAWTHNAAVQVVLDKQQAVAAVGDQKVQTTYRIDVPNSPCLRVIKVASTHMAKPGDIIDFTIRFDNTGDQTIGNVTLVDNLTTRLEYVPNSARSSRAAEFFTERNEGESLVLRWEFTDPLPAGAGGLVRFHCKVR